MPALLRLLAVAAVLCAAGVAAAQAPKSADEVKKAIAARFGVEVLRVQPVDDNGRPAYLVTVMSPGGNRNDAFQVNRILVDAATAEPVSQFRHRTSGYDLPGDGERRPLTDDNTAAIRRQSFPE